MNRYQELFRIEDNYFLAGSPVLIEKGALLKDLKLERLIAQLKIKNYRKKLLYLARLKFNVLNRIITRLRKL